MSLHPGAAHKARKALLCLGVQCSARVLAQGWHRDLRDPVGSACLAPPCADCAGKPESRVNPLKMDTSKNYPEIP